MKVESRNLRSIKVRHLSFKGCPSGDYVVWWYGAVVKNRRAQSLPHVVVSFRKLLPDGTFANGFEREVGITDLGLLQIGTIWNEWSCNRRLAWQEHKFKLDFTPGCWRFTSQREHDLDWGAPLILPTAYPLNRGERDRSQLLCFDLSEGRQLLVPSLEFFSRYYGRSGHVSRVLATYPWSAAEDRLYVPFEYASQPGEWPIKLASSTYNADALLLAHVKYDRYARRAAKSIYAGLEAEYEAQGGMAFPKIYPWFTGPASLIVQGLWLDERRFLALRIEGGSDPHGPNISVYRENPGTADEAAPGGAPVSSWKGGRDLRPDMAPSIVNLTSDDEPDHSGNILEVLNPAFRVVGPKREIVRHRLATASTRAGPPTPNEQADQHSPGERHGSARGTGVASIHTEVVLESEGAIRDVWNGLQYLCSTRPDQIVAVGWYSADTGRVNSSDEPSMVALQPFDADEQVQVGSKVSRWVFMEPDQPRLRGVLVCFVKTPERAAFLFEVERKKISRTDEDGQKKDREESYSGLIVLAPARIRPSDWIPRVLDGIRRQRGVMEGVINYCPDGQGRDYRRSTSRTDQVAGHSTIINALSKVGIDIPKPKRSRSEPADQSEWTD